MRALTLLLALALTPAVFAQTPEPAWKSWLRQGETYWHQGETYVRKEAPKVSARARAEAKKLAVRAQAEIANFDVQERWNFVQEMWRIRGSLMLDPDTILCACGMDRSMIEWIRRFNQQ
ncbi:hypothetical protein EON81_28930 [bacterium]|nr:MAG: hypothetical protein EON81_28930 [bacterium]